MESDSIFIQFFVYLHYDNKRSQKKITAIKQFI
jgi:hypothetical protein